MNPTQKKTLLTLVILVVLFAAAAYYFFAKYQALKTNPETINQEEVMALVAEVGKIIVLPEGEMPTVATVADPTILQDQPFFKNAKTGDKVLIYATAQRAILYDPIAKKIVEVAPIRLGDDSTTGALETETPQPAPTPDDTTVDESARI